jgi:hypothetical protein
MRLAGRCEARFIAGHAAFRIGFTKCSSLWLFKLTCRFEVVGPGIKFIAHTGSAVPPRARLPRMGLIIILIVLVLLFGGGGYYMEPGLGY